MSDSMERETPDETYCLSCADCAYDTTTVGQEAALDLATEHQQTHGDRPTDHFVDIALGRTIENCC